MECCCRWPCICWWPGSEECKVHRLFYRPAAPLGLPPSATCDCWWPAHWSHDSSSMSLTRSGNAGAAMYWLAGGTGHKNRHKWKTMARYLALLINSFCYVVYFCDPTNRLIKKETKQIFIDCEWIVSCSQQILVPFLDNKNFPLIAPEQMVRKISYPTSS